MDLLFSIIKYFFIGLFGLVAIVVVITILFGKRVHKQWDYEAKFMNGRSELGEFDIESYRLEDEEDYRLEVKCVLKDPRLQPGNRIEVYLDGQLVMTGMVEKAGRVYLGKDDLLGTLDNPAAGQVCEFKCEGETWYTSSLQVD